MKKKNEVENRFDKDFKFSESTTSFEQVLANNERLRLELAKKFLSADIDQKTEVSKAERFNIPLLDILAENPFPISSRICKNTAKQSKSSILSQFIRKYFVLGVPLNRKGRIEDKEVLESTLSTGLAIERETFNRRDTRNKLLK